jgi:hypothetical protein
MGAPLTAIRRGSRARVPALRVRVSVPAARAVKKDR